MGSTPEQAPSVYRFVISPAGPADPRSIAYLSDAHALGLSSVEKITCHDLFFIEGELNEDAASRLIDRLLADPLTQRGEWSPIEHTAPLLAGGLQVIEVALRPGVTDPVAEQIVRAARELQIPGVQRASTGQRFLVTGHQLDEEALSLLAKRLLANPIIQRFSLGEIQPVFPESAGASGAVERIAIRGMDDDALMALSTDRRAALDLAEMQAVRRYYLTEGRDMTDVEFEAIAQTWSEHCVHKTFKAQITILNPGAGDSTAYSAERQVDNLLKTYLRSATNAIAAPWVRSAFVDNAGIIDFDEQFEISYKVETHNHPSAIEPFGGANTGVGGVIRDVIGVSAKPIAAADVLCFGPARTSFEDLPAGVLHPRRVRSGVIAGVQDYGNKIGIPTVSGAIYYDPGYTTNPLVFCGCAGIAPKDLHRRTPENGDHVVVLGGRTGRDGLRGATFSSMTMDVQTGEVAGASVQIGAPIVEKGLIDVIVQARDQGLYTAITDCGAGGLSSAVGEMASTIGADVELEDVQLKYPGLAPWEIWLSEAQERMVLAVPDASLPAVKELCRVYGVELTDIGRFTGDGRLVVRYGGEVVLNLANAFLHDGIPQRRLDALLPPPCAEQAQPSRQPFTSDYTQVLLDLLAHPNIASKAATIHIYDHEVQGGTVIKPLTGACNDGPSDAAVLKPAGTRGATAVALGAGLNPEYGKRSAYLMAVSVIDEAIRNVVAVGADPSRIALLDNFCWGDPKDPEVLGMLVECSRGCRDAALIYRAPFISGKDSLNNETMDKDGRRHAIPPTLLISSIGMLPDLTRAVTMDLKQPGSLLYLVGDFAPTLAGSHFSLVNGAAVPGACPGLPKDGPQVYARVYDAVQSGLVRACHDLSEGGLAVAAAEMCIGGRLGLSLTVQADDPLTTLFGETNGCLLIEVSPRDAGAFEALLSGLPMQRIGAVTGEPTLAIHGLPGPFELSTAALVAAWTKED